MQRFYSISSKPGVFGKTLYNSAFKELGIEACYEPVGLEINQFKKWMDFITEFEQTKGISVSMPFKKHAYKYCDVVKLGNYVKLIVNNVNTIKVDNGETIGYNTDIVGFEYACRDFLKRSRTAVVVGKGAVSDSIAVMLKKYRIEHRNVGRVLEKGIDYSADFFINASPVGMQGVSNEVISSMAQEFDYRYVFDVVVSTEPTKIIKNAEKKNIPYVAGWKMSLEQLCEQFRIYTDIKPPCQLFEKKLYEMGYR